MWFKKTDYAGVLTKEQRVRNRSLPYFAKRRSERFIRDYARTIFELDEELLTPIEDFRRFEASVIESPNRKFGTLGGLLITSDGYRGSTSSFGTQTKGHELEMFVNSSDEYSAKITAWQNDSIGRRVSTYPNGKIAHSTGLGLIVLSTNLVLAASEPQARLPTH